MAAPGGTQGRLWRSLVCHQAGTAVVEMCSGFCYICRPGAGSVTVGSNLGHQEDRKWDLSGVSGVVAWA